MDMWLRKLFQKKKTESIDLSKYKLKFDIKTICYFEKIRNKSFFNFNDDDIPYLVYSSFINNNDVDITFSAFVFLMENEKISEWILTKLKDIFDVIYQFNSEENTNDSENNLTITDIATSLIIYYGVDANYVMKQMDIWEITSLFQAAENKEHRRLEEERLFTYLNILPHIDGKKLRSPEKLLPFAWEKENKPENRMEKDKKYLDDFVDFWNNKEIEESTDGTK